jgi:hypothetical protein
MPGRFRGAPSSVFPAKAGTQTLARRLEAAPTPNPLPLKGGMGFNPRHCERSEATQGTDTELS